jgi:hypothetical protein
VSRSKGRRSPDGRRRLRAPWPLRSLQAWMGAAWIGTFAVMAYGLHQLEPYAQRMNTANTVIEWVATPEWLNDQNWRHVLPELEAHVNLHPDTDPFDDRVCPYVAERLKGSPWISTVRRVSKQSDGRVKVSADFRKPFAMIECRGIAYLVDETGVRLPQQWASRGLNRGGWMAIRAVAAPPPPPGERWPGEDVAAGLKLASFLYRAETKDRIPFRDEIRAIDVGNFDGRRNPRAGRLQLVTTNPQSYIHWGLPPGEEYGYDGNIESTAEMKLAMLCRLHAAEGHLPDKGPIDVRAEDAIVLGDPK